MYGLEYPGKKKLVHYFIGYLKLSAGIEYSSNP
jgi:hypothetical protein